MSSGPFTPSAESIETAWVIMCQQSRISTQPPESELIAEFTRFVNSIKADAWDEGYEAGNHDTREFDAVTESRVDYDDYEDTPNPYRDDV